MGTRRGRGGEIMGNIVIFFAANVLLAVFLYRFVK